MKASPSLDRNEWTISELRHENRRLRDAMKRAADIIDKHIYGQREKAADASSILRSAMAEGDAS